MTKFLRCFKLFFLLSISLQQSYSQNAQQYLNEIPLYTQASTFLDANYENFTWQQFEKLAETKQLIDPSNYDYHLLNAAIFFEVNKLREGRNIGTLQFNSKLRNAAALHTHRMVAQHFFSHINSKDSKLAAPPDRLAIFSFDGEKIGENVADGFMNMSTPKTYVQLADEIIHRFLASPEHKEIMLRAAYTQLGCALEFEKDADKDGFWHLKVTQDYGKLWDK